MPFLGLIIANKALQPLKAVLLASLPTRFYRDLPEIPIGILVALNVAVGILACLSDVLPYAAYEAANAGEETTKTQKTVVSHAAAAEISDSVQGIELMVYVNE